MNSLLKEFGAKLIDPPMRIIGIEPIKITKFDIIKSKIKVIFQNIFKTVWNCYT